MWWVCVREDFLGTAIYGLFETAAKASGFGFSNFGPIRIGNRWSVRKVNIG